MNKTLHHGVTATIGALMAGCAATNPPLMFGDSTTFGLRLGNDTATAGGSVSLGYKAQSVAVVPVSMLGADGIPRLLNGHGDDGLHDALSVFASFKSTAADKEGDKSTQTIRLGQVFSTGLAAQALTLGYLCRERTEVSCGKTAAENAKDAAAVRAAAPPAAARPTPAPGTATTGPVADDRPYQAPLLFLRTDVLGFNIGGSLAEQGLKFDLGYTNRNLALIPVVAAGSGGKAVGLLGHVEPSDTAARPLQDAYSVMGQFDTNTETARLGFGLERYFATGVAAYNLSESMRSVIARAPSTVAPAASAALASATKTAGNP